MILKSIREEGRLMMGLDILSRQLDAAIKNNEDLHYLGRNLGFWLANHLSDDDCHQLGVLLQNVNPDRDAFAHGYRQALADIVSAWLLAHDEQEENEKCLALASQEPGKQILLTLLENLATDNEFDESMRPTLIQMEQYGIVERLPKFDKDQRFGGFRLTARGRELARNISLFSRRTNP